MIRITDARGMSHALHPDAVASISEAGVSGKWHGIYAYVRTFDGRIIEAGEDVATIASRIDAARKEQQP